MSRRIGSALLAAALLVPLTGSVLPAGAAAPALTVSVTAGAPGTAISVTGTGCTSTDDADRSIVTNLVSGTAPNERLAGQSETFDGIDDEGSQIIIPTWIDPARPAVIEAACWEFRYDLDVPVGAKVFSYDPVAFDVLAGPGNPQTAVASRTTAASGQLIKFTLTDCTSSSDFDGPSPSGLLFTGTDLTGRTLGQPIGFADSGYEDGVHDASYLFLSEDESPLPNGDYTFVPSCSTDEGSVGYEPQIITVAGTKPTDQIELRTNDTSTVTLAGSGCLTGDVQVGLAALPLNEFPEDPAGIVIDTGAEPTRLHRTRDGLVVSPVTGRNRFAAPRSTRADDPFVSYEATVTPDGDGSWSVSWDTGINGSGIVLGFATCGDPLAEGFLYNRVFGEFNVIPPTTSTSTPATTPAATPQAAAPAQAVSAKPTYAG